MVGQHDEAVQVANGDGLGGDVGRGGRRIGGGNACPNDPIDGCATRKRRPINPCPQVERRPQIAAHRDSLAVAERDDSEAQDGVGGVEESDVGGVDCVGGRVGAVDGDIARDVNPSPRHDMERSPRIRPKGDVAAGQHNGVVRAEQVGGTAVFIF